MNTPKEFKEFVEYLCNAVNTLTTKVEQLHKDQQILLDHTVEIKDENTKKKDYLKVQYNKQKAKIAKANTKEEENELIISLNEIENELKDMYTKENNKKIEAGKKALENIKECITNTKMVPVAIKDKHFSNLANIVAKVNFNNTKSMQKAAKDISLNAKKEMENLQKYMSYSEVSTNETSGFILDANDSIRTKYLEYLAENLDAGNFDALQNKADEVFEILDNEDDKRKNMNSIKELFGANTEQVNDIDNTNTESANVTNAESAPADANDAEVAK